MKKREGDWEGVQEKKRGYERYIARNKDGVYKVGKEMERQREREKGIDIEK